MTLCSLAASSALVPGLYEQMKYLIKGKKADPTITDGRGLDTVSCVLFVYLFKIDCDLQADGYQVYLCH